MSKEVTDIGRELKKELILKDYDCYIDGIVRNQERIISLRQWEITLLVASYGYALSQGIVQNLLPIAAAILVGFGLIEALINGRIRRREQRLEETIKSFSGRDDLSEILSSYVFEHTKWSEITFREKVTSTLGSLLKPDCVVWKGALAIVSIAVYFLFS